MNNTMSPATVAFHGGGLVASIVIIIVCATFVFKTGGTSALKDLLLLTGIFIIKGLALHFYGPTAEYIFTGFALVFLLVVYRRRWMDLTPKTKEQQRITIMKFIFFIFAAIGACALVFMIYKKAGII